MIDRQALSTFSHSDSPRDTNLECSVFLHFALCRSEAIIAGFLAMIPPTCHAVRDGSLKSLPAAELVLGDVVLLRTGDKTPADCVIISATDLKVDNSSLTGESEPQERMAKPNGMSCRAVEAENIAFNSTLVVNGEAYGGEANQHS